MDLSWTELLVVAVVALLLFGPKELPELARSSGRGLRRIRRLRQQAEQALNDALREIERDVDLDGRSPAGGPERKPHATSPPAAPIQPNLPAVEQEQPQPPGNPPPTDKAHVAEGQVPPCNP